MIESAKINQNKFFDKEAINEKHKCIICFTNAREVIIEPCNHFCMCLDCLESLCNSVGDNLRETCPLCKSQISGFSNCYSKKEQ